MGLAWVVAIVALAIPVLVAESSAAAGDEHLRTGSPARAAASYREAAAAVPYNADYPFRESNVAGSVDLVRQAFDRAAQANPVHAGYRFSRAAFEAALPQPDAARVKSAFEAGLAIDPANVAMRVRYAEALEKLNLPAEAKAQYETALAYDDQLDPVEVERLPSAKVADIRARIARLDPTPPATAPATVPATSPAP
jgi:tetratricopeptide (TPR) repeat protein